MPMIAILIESGVWALRRGTNRRKEDPVQQSDAAGEASERETFSIVRNMAVSQLLLTLLTLTTAHVQIITRISSAYPVWLWYLAAASRDGNALLAKIYLRFMVIYAIVQGGLFASFLPPA